MTTRRGFIKALAGTAAAVALGRSMVTVDTGLWKGPNFIVISTPTGPNWMKELYPPGDVRGPLAAWFEEENALKTLQREAFANMAIPSAVLTQIHRHSEIHQRSFLQEVERRIELNRHLNLMTYEQLHKVISYATGKNPSRVSYDEKVKAFNHILEVGGYAPHIEMGGSRPSMDKPWTLSDIEPLKMELKADVRHAESAIVRVSKTLRTET